MFILGNMDALRDWGHAKDYVRMQWMMLQQEQADDFVIATGKQISVREFVKIRGAFNKINALDPKELEKGIVCAVDNSISPSISVGDTIIRIDSEYFRPTEVESLLGDSTKARETLGWKAEISVQEMCREMVAHDLENAKKNALLKNNGF